MPKNKKKDKKKQTGKKPDLQAEVERLRKENNELRSRLEQIADLAADLSPRTALVANPFDEDDDEVMLEEQIDGLPLTDPPDSPEKAPVSRRRSSADRPKAG